MFTNSTRLEPGQNQILSKLGSKLENIEHHLKRQSEHEDIEILGNFKKGKINFEAFCIAITYCMITYAL